MVTVRSTAFPSAKQGDNNAPTEPAPESEKASLTEWIGEELQKSDRPELGSASRVVSGGRALKSRENFDKIMFSLADALGAAGKREAVYSLYVGC